MTYGKNCFYLEVPDAQHQARDWRARITYPLLIFAGTVSNFNIQKIEIVIETIPSQSSNRIYRRINPIITTQNGIRYSASTQASYELLNPSAGEVKPDGSFYFSGQDALQVKVKYGEWEEVVDVRMLK